MKAMTAKQEWASMWQLPLVSMLGVSGSAIFAFSSGVFMERMTAEFGWSRAGFSTAFALQTLLGLLVLPATGWLVDRIGPRKVALIGAPCFILAFSLLGLADGVLSHWWLSCLLLGVCQGSIAQTVWVTAVVGRFHRSRGLAMAVTLAGLGLGSMIWPILSAFYIERLGWRATFPALALSWGVTVLPLVALYFHGPEEQGPRSPSRPSARAYGTALGSATFIGLLLAGGLFASAYYGLTVHLVPILRENGLGLGAAAGIAGLVGLFSIIGRILTGYLLDRLPVRPIGIVVFLLPVGVISLLFFGHGSLSASIFAIALLGLASGAEMDIVTFIAVRRFGREIFGSVYAIFMAILSISASSGPIIAGALFDKDGSYASFFLIVAPMAAISTLLIMLIPIDPAGDQRPAG